MRGSRRDIIRSIRRLRKDRAARAARAETRARLTKSFEILEPDPDPDLEPEAELASEPEERHEPEAAPGRSQEAPLVIVEPAGRLAFRDPTDAENILSAWMAGKSKTTLKTYRQDLRALAKWLGLKGPAEVVRQIASLRRSQANALVLRWLGAMKDAGLSSGTRARRLSTLKSVVKAIRSADVIDWAIEVRGPRVQSLRDTSGPGFEAAQKMLDVCGKGKWGKRDRAILLLGLTLGLRREEICKLEISSYKSGKLSFSGKGDKEALLTVPDETAKALDAWLAVRGEYDHQGMFVGAKCGGHLTVDGCYYIVRKLSRKAGVKHVAPHGLRHTAVTEALDGKNQIREVQHFSRHSKSDTVKIYDDNKQDFAGKIAQQLAKKFTQKDNIPSVPEGYEAELSEYGPVLFDMGCSEPVGWGFKILRVLGPERFTALKEFGKPHCIEMGEWVLITKWLTAEEAIEKYGPRNDLVLGPKGGFRSITYGDKVFRNPCMKPELPTPEQDEDLSLEDLLEAAGNVEEGEA